MAARRSNIPAVVHAREIPSHDPDLCAWLGGTPEGIVASIIEEADYIIANSRATAAAFPTLGRTSVVPNCVDSGEFDLGPGEREGPVRVALIGNTHSPKKGLLEFLVVARMLAKRVNAQFVVVGPESALTRSLQGAVPDNVVFAGYAKTPRAAMAQADIVVSLSTIPESFGRVVLEGMAARLPVVAFAWGAMPELILDLESGYLVAVGDLDAVAARIENLCLDARLRHRMGEAGRRVAKQKFSPARLASDLRSSYRAILPGSAARAAAARDFSISLPSVNNSHFRQPFYVGNRARFAHCTGVKFIDSERFVCTSLIGQRMYLVRFDARERTSTIEACLPTRNESGDVSTDLLDYDGGRRLLTSNCEHRSISLYEIVDGAISFTRTVSIGEEGGYCHGAKFVPGRPDLVCATSIDRGRRVVFLSIRSGRAVYLLRDGPWLAKDVCFLGPDLMVVVSTRGYVGPDPGTEIESKVSLIGLTGAPDDHEVLHETIQADAQFDGCHGARGIVYVADQARDVVHRYDTRGNKLKRQSDLEGFSFPHGIDVSADGTTLAVANYGPNTISLRAMAQA